MNLHAFISIYIHRLAFLIPLLVTKITYLALDIIFAFLGIKQDKITTCLNPATIRMVELLTGKLVCRIPISPGKITPGLSAVTCLKGGQDGATDISHLPLRSHGGWPKMGKLGNWMENHV
jgi:hypothetical protein